jgi:hypothetical protein
MVAVHAAPDVWHNARQLARQANRSLSVVQQRHSRGSTALALGRVPEQAGAAAAIPGASVRRRDLKCEQKSLKHGHVQTLWWEMRKRPHAHEGDVASSSAP